jgi:head-tail adaptor
MSSDSTFDGLLNKTAHILKRSAGTTDSYGQADPTFVELDTVPCFISSFGRRSGTEKRANTKFATADRTIFMNVWTGTGSPLTHEHWLQVDGVLYDIQGISDPGELGHHLEVLVQAVVP